MTNKKTPKLIPSAKQAASMRKEYEEASGNTVVGGWVYDSRGYKIAQYSYELAMNYLDAVAEEKQ